MPTKAPNLNLYGSYIGTIIIVIVFIIGLIIIIDEVYNMCRFCYRYTYLYNYGTMNETTCKEAKLEYERARFRIYNEIANYKFNKDLFTKSWINYVYFIAVMILTILLCIAFGYLFKHFFIDTNDDCNVKFENPTSEEQTKDWSYLKLIIKCLLGDSYQKLIPNCLINYIILGIIIIGYPLIYILKVFFKIDYTWNSGFIMKTLHGFFFLILILYTYYLYVSKEDKNDSNYIKILIYITFIIVFYVTNHFFNVKFDEYSNLYQVTNPSSTFNEKDDIDTTFFDIYKQQEPTKPVTIVPPPQLQAFKYCSSNDFNNPNNLYCSNINRNVNQNDYYNNDYYNCMISDDNYKQIITNYINSRDYYKLDKLMIDNYYERLKLYENDMKIYNYKYNIYQNNKNEFPEIVYFLYHMCPKMFGIYKSEIKILFILLIVTILITYYLKTIDNPNTDFVYYSIFLYILGLLSISILVNAILTYNTYVNKYLIYEPVHNYKNALNNKNTIFNIIINSDPNLKNLLTLTTQKYNNELISVNLGKTSRFNTLNMTIEEFSVKITDDPSFKLTDNDSLVNPKHDQTTPPSPERDYLLNVQLKFYKAIYSSMIDIKTIKNDNNDITQNFLIFRQNKPDNYTKFNYYKIDTIDPRYITHSTLTASSTNDLKNYRFFIKMIEKIFIASEIDVTLRINQLQLNLDYYIYNESKDLNLNLASITNLNEFVSILDEKNHYQKEINRNIDVNQSKIIRNVINNYNYNKNLIDKAFGIYAEFLIEFRKIIVELLNNVGVSCDYIDFIDINSKIKQFNNKLFKNGVVTSFKNSKDEPNIEIYKKILDNGMIKINDLMLKYMNLIKIYIKSFVTAIDLAKSNNDIMREIINNYNIYNTDSKRHVNNELLQLFFKVEGNYNKNKSKYENYDSIDIKKLKISSNNVSWSFTILIIIFAIILIEPIII